MDNNNFYDAVVIGGGPAGLTAGLYLARACCRVLVVEKETFGGQITITSEVVNYPGSGPVSGRELTERMRKQAENFGCEFLSAEVKSLDLTGGVRKVETDRGTLECLGLILATGAHPRMVGFRGEEEYKGHGVAYCATCDGEFFTGKEVFVVGGGFAAAEEAVFLTKYASHVTILIRGDDFKCAKATADEARNHENITVLTNTTVDEVSGDAMLRKIIYRNTKTGAVTEFSPDNGDTFGVFVFAGYSPSTELLRGIAELDDRGYVVTDRQQKTSVDGVYAAGDVCIKNLRQVVTATSDGATAATELEKYISVMQKKTGRRAERVVARAAAHRTADSGRDGGPAGAGAAAAFGASAAVSGATAAASGASSAGLFDDDMKSQLAAVFARMEHPLRLRLYLDGRAISGELEQYMTELAAMTDKLTVEKAGDGNAADAADGVETADLPCVRVLREDGTWSGLAFHGVPGGHEFTSFVLGLYNASGTGQALDAASFSRIKNLKKDIHMTILVSLTCTMCPELVTAAQKIASLSPRVTTDVYDLNHFPEMKARYNVMSVPCYVLNDGAPLFGKKKIAQLLDVMEQL